MIDNATYHVPKNDDARQFDTSTLPLVSIIRYFDDFSDRTRTIRTNQNEWSLIIDGITISIDWKQYEPNKGLFLKKYMVWACANLDATTAGTYLGALNRDASIISKFMVILSKPETAKLTWENDGFNTIKENSLLALRSISKFMCEMSLCGWTVEDIEYMRGWKWFSPRNVSTVEHGVSYHLSLSEEQTIVSYFEKLALRPHDFSFDALRNATILYFCYQFGMRPIQIGSVTGEDISTHQVGSKTIAHVTFHKAKQKKGKQRQPLLRKVKREWTSMIVTYLKLRKHSNEIQSDLVRLDSLFNLTPPQISNRVLKLSTTLLGRSVSPTLFRHIAAQRMADLGMSQLELAEFMGHTDIDSCLVYFENSAAQGHIVNRALGLSDIYIKVKEMTKPDLLAPNALHELNEDQQIGGAAHGIPLAGIGGCAIGQSMCELSPAISCYTCPKFMPLNDLKLHKTVADDLRDVVSSFVEAGRNDNSNPAFAQLSRTMESLTAIIKLIESESE